MWVILDRSIFGVHPDGLQLNKGVVAHRKVFAVGGRSWRLRDRSLHQRGGGSGGPRCCGRVPRLSEKPDGQWRAVCRVELHHIFGSLSWKKFGDYFRWPSHLLTIRIHPLLTKKRTIPILWGSESRDSPTLPKIWLTIMLNRSIRIFHTADGKYTPFDLVQGSALETIFCVTPLTTWSTRPV